MKKSIVIAASMLFAVAGFTQTAETSTSVEAKPHCAKGKPACCAHAEGKKECQKGTASVSPASSSGVSAASVAPAAPVATEPRKETATEKTEGIN